MPARRALATGVPALFACALALAACGGEEGTIPRAEGEQLLVRLDSIEQAANAGDCELARTDAEEFVAEARALPGSVDPEVRDALVAAGTKLIELTADPSECQTPDVGTTTEEMTTDAETTTPEPETTTTTTTTDEEQTTTEETTTTDETDEQPPPPPPDEGGEDGAGSGGIGADG